MRYFTRGALALLLIVAACGGRACGETIDSSTVDFSTIEARYDVKRNEPDKTRVEVELTFDSDTIEVFDTIRFNEGEKLFVDGVEIGYDEISYKGSFPVEADATSLKIKFRDKNGVSHAQSVILATPISITGPAPGTKVDATDEFTVTYAPKISAHADVSWGDIHDDNPDNGDAQGVFGEGGTFTIPLFEQLPPSDTTLEITAKSTATNPDIPAGFVLGFITSQFYALDLELVAK